LPLAVVPAEQDGRGARGHAEKMLSQVVVRVRAGAAQSIPLTRVDHNFASGIARGVAETRARR
jgi:hypothetical protein